MTSWTNAAPHEVEVEALVDTGATRLYLKPSVMHALGLEKVDTVISALPSTATSR